ncbi:MAG: winged helix-turn-helix transcriptional regulator [Collinsella sp.]
MSSCNDPVGTTTRQELAARLKKSSGSISTYKKRLVEAGVIESLTRTFELHCQALADMSHRFTRGSLLRRIASCPFTSRSVTISLLLGAYLLQTETNWQVAF